MQKRAVTMLQLKVNEEGFDMIRTDELTTTKAGAIFWSLLLKQSGLMMKTIRKRHRILIIEICR